MSTPRGFSDGFPGPPPLIGVVHLLPLPGSPAPAALDAILARAVADATTWREGGADAVLIENFGDAPFHPARVPAVTVAALARVLAAVAARCPGPLGVNVLRNDAAAALALASVFDLAFFRVNVHAGVAVADQGLLHGQAHETVRERARLPGAPLILADVCVKHARPLVPRPLVEEAADLWHRAGADALLLTGPATGAAVPAGDLDAVRRALPDAPLLLASGVDPAAVAATRGVASGWIVGTWAQGPAGPGAAPDPARVRALVAARDGR